MSPAVAALLDAALCARGPHTPQEGRKWVENVIDSASFARCYTWALNAEWLSLDAEAQGALLPAISAAIARAPSDANLAGAAGGFFHLVALHGRGFGAFELAAAAVRARGGDGCAILDAWLVKEFLHYGTSVLCDGAHSQGASCALGALVSAAAGDQALLARCADSVAALTGHGAPFAPELFAVMRSLLPPAVWREAAARALEPARAALEKLRVGGRSGRSQGAISNAERFVSELELATRT